MFTAVMELVNARMGQTKRGVKMVSALFEKEKALDMLVRQSKEKSVAESFAAVSNEPVYA